MQCVEVFASLLLDHRERMGMGRVEVNIHTYNPVI